MFTTFVVLLLSFFSAAAAPASCLSLPADEQPKCMDERVSARAIEINSLTRKLNELEVRCDQTCNTTPAPVVRSAGPSQIRKDVNKLQEQVKILEEKVAEGVVSDAELEAALTLIRADITRIDGTLNRHEATLSKHEARIKALENAKPIPGKDGTDGKDGLPAEIAVLAGVGGVHSQEWNIVGGEVTLQVGGRLLENLRLGGYGSGFIAGANDLGFGVGGYLGYDLDWLRPNVTFGWHEIGLDIASNGARRSLQGVKLTGALELRPLGNPWVVSVNVGAFLPGGDPALTWGVSTGARF